MNRAANLINLCEKFSSGQKNISTNAYYEIFENPTKSEWRECNKDGTVRWIADLKTEKLWAWNGEGLIHYSVLRLLQKEQSLFTGYSYSTAGDKQVLSADFERYILGHTSSGESTSDTFEFLTEHDEFLLLKEETKKKKKVLT